MLSKLKYSLSKNLFGGKYQLDLLTFTKVD